MEYWVRQGTGRPERPRPASSNPQSPIRNRGPPAPGIGFVLHVSLLGRAMAHRQLSLPIYPNPPKFGFVLHDFLHQPPAAGQIGFVLRI
jgi:hypothetical protein